MKKLHILCSSFAIAFTVSISSLSAQINTVENTPSKWSARIDFYNLLKSGSPSVVISKQFAENRAWRSSASMLIANQNIANKYLLRNTDISIATGLEWQYHKGKSQFFHGPEIGFGIYKEKQDRRPLSPNPIDDYLVKGFNVSAGYFAGFKYTIYGPFSIWAESSLWTKYQKSTSNQTTTKDNYDTKFFRFEFLPLRYIGVIYSF